MKQNSSLFLPLFFCFICFTLLLYSCSSIPSFLKNNSPVLQSNKFKNESGIKDVIVSFNIENGKKNHQAIKEFKEDSILKKTTVLFLQEVHENVVIAFADSFNLNYVYYPISINSKNSFNYGNAILTKYPILDSKKILLPHEKWTNKRRRSATYALIKPRLNNIHLYSTHLETIVMGRGKRMDQLDKILQDCNQLKSTEKVVVGGDFNTLKRKHLSLVVQSFDDNGFVWAVRDIGATSRAFLNLIKPRNDHIFIRGLGTFSSGKKEDSHSSDHLPVWVELAF